MARKVINVEENFLIPSTYMGPNRMILILCYFITFAEIERIQKMTRRALDMTWRNSLSHDWISPDRAKTFPLMEYYTDLRWTRTVKRALLNSQERLSSIFDILSLPRAGEEPTNVLVEGKVSTFLERSFLRK